jgi:transposase-like protein
MFLVAFGLFLSETKDNWEWFFRQLSRAIGHVAPLAICTDAGKGLENAVKIVFPHADQRECHAHLMLNLSKHFSGTVCQYMCLAGRSYSPRSFRYIMDRIIGECPSVEEHLRVYHCLLWMMTGFDSDIKCDYINNNLVESFNSQIKDTKDLPLHMLMETIRGMRLFK